MVCTKIYRDAKDGQFEKVLEAIHSESKTLVDEDYMKILYGIYEHLKENGKLQLDVLTVLLKTIALNVKNTAPKIQDKYLNISYHIIVYLCNKNALVTVLQVKHMVLPCINNFSDNQITIFKALEILIHNTVFVQYVMIKELLPQFLIFWLEINKYLIKSREYSKFYEKLNIYTRKLKHIDSAKFYSTLDIIFNHLLNFIPEKGDINDLDAMNRFYITVIELCVYFRKERADNHEYLSKYFACFKKLIDSFLNNNNVSKQLNYFLELFNVLFIGSDDLTTNNLLSTITEFDNILKPFSITENVLIISFIYDILLRFLDVIHNFTEYAKLDLNKNNFITLFTFINKVSEIISTYKISKIHNEKCNCALNTYDAIELMNLNGFNLLNFLKCNHDVTFETEVINDFIKQNISYIELLKINECDSWLKCWQRFEILIYNCAVISKPDELKIQFYSLCIDNIIKFDGLKVCHLNLGQNKNDLQICLCAIASLLMQSMDYKLVLKHTAFAVYLDPDVNNKCWSHWCVARYKLKNDPNINVASIKSVLQEYSEEFKSLYSHFEIENDKLLSAIHSELYAYFKYWNNRMAITNALNDFLNSTDDAVKQAEIFASVCKNRLPTLDDTLLNSLKVLIKTFTKTINKKTKACYENILLGHLYLIDYRFKQQEFLDKNKKDMEEMKVLAKQSEELQKQQEDKTVDVNPNDQCDIVTTYGHLKLSLYMTLLTSLKKAVSQWENCVQNAEESIEEIQNGFQNLNTLDCLEGIAQDYRLNNHMGFAFKTWTLMLEISKMVQSDKFTLLSTGYILDVVDACSDYANQLATNAYPIIQRMENSSDASAIEAIITFYIGSSCSNYNSRLYSQGFEDFKTANEYFKKIESNIFLQGRLGILKEKYMKLPCSLKVMDHRTELNAAHLYKILRDVNAADQTEILKRSNWAFDNMYKNLQFELSLSLGKKFRMICMPRESRCYLKCWTIHAQESLLPLTTARFLTNLAFVDIISGKADDCYIKLEGIASILCESLQKEYSAPVELRPGSPYFPSIKFQMPSFCSHLPECECFKCSSIDYWSLLFEKMHIEAQLYVLHKNYKAANQYFCKTYDFYKHLIKNSDRFTSRFSLDCEKSLLNVERYFCEHDIYPTFLLDYIKLCQKIEDFERAKHLNTELIGLIYKKLCINGTIILQATVIRDELYYPLMKDDKDEGRPTRDTLDVPVLEQLMKTPESKITAMKIPNSIEVTHSVPKKRTYRRKILIAEDWEGDDNIKLDTRKTNSTNSGTVRLKASNKPKSTLKGEEAKKTGRRRFGEADAAQVINKLTDDISKLKCSEGDKNVQAKDENSTVANKMDKPKRGPGRPSKKTGLKI